ncbi:MAG: hypothetical protein ACW97P_09385 [Candidatus Hodarchaeales archaeon]|jgi:hypothetical protein
MKIDLSNYERTVFSEKTTNRSITKNGYKVGDHLVVSYSTPNAYRYKDNQYRVYRTNDGLPAIKTTFVSYEDAIRFAEWLRSIYEEYFFLWREYPYAEIFRWTYRTVKNGEEYWMYLKDLESKRDIKWNGYKAL